MLRIICLILALLIVYLLSLETVRRWDDMPARLHRALPPIIASFGVAAYGFYEAYKQQAPLGFRVLLWTLVAIWLIIALLINVREERSLYPERRREQMRDSDDQAA